jgi:hypothetical protein
MYQDMMTSLLHEINRTIHQAYLPKSRPLPKILWKTVNAAHQNCWEAGSRPLTTPPTVNAVTDTYAWRLFDAFDEFAYNLSSAFAYDVMDMHALKLRPDAHPGQNAMTAHGKIKDCLHYCLPGPLNIFSQFMMHYLYFL